MYFKANNLRHWHMLLMAFMLALFVAGTTKANASSTVVAADGAVAENGPWEQGTSSIWRIEEQQYADELIQYGVSTENDSDIQYGLLILNWAFAHQTADGGFDGTAGGTVSGEFHSTSLFVEAAAHALLALKTYDPVTYTPTIPYSTVVAGYAQKLHAAALWLNNPTVAAAGQAGDFPFTHRRYLLAAALGQTGELCGDSSLMAAAQQYCINGVALQLGSGWTAAMYPEDANGGYPVATLVAPGTSDPAGTSSVISAVGVDPENSGFDVNYQCAGFFFAEHYYDYAPVAQQQELTNVFESGLNWESSRIDVNGNLNWYGSSRMGVELNNSGVIKTPDMTEIIPAFSTGSTISKTPAFNIVANRLAHGTDAVDHVVVSADGAASNNVAYETNPSLGWSIADQTEGIKYIQQGIFVEHDALIQQGIQILNWGLSRQIANGSFAGSGNIYIGTAQFVECIDQAAQTLAAYHPGTYTPTTNYAAVATAWEQQALAAANWLATPTYAASILSSIGLHTSRAYMVAAAFAETGSMSGSAALVADAVPYLTLGLSMELPDGVDPESGLFDPNYQTESILYAERTYPTVTSSTLKRSLMGMITLGLDYEELSINGAGAVANDSGASSTILSAFELGYTMTSSPLYQVVVNRMTNSAISGVPTTITETTTPTPLITPASSTVPLGQLITIADSFDGAAIYYTINGTTPSTKSTLYTGPFALPGSETIKAIAVASGYKNSNFYTSVLKAVEPVPVITPGSGAIAVGQTVTIADSVTSSTMYYTTDGTTPTVKSNVYSGTGVAITSSLTLSAIAVSANYAPSAVATATLEAIAPTPVINPGSGDVNTGQTITISDSLAGASIYFTTNSTLPTTSSTLYSGPITLGPSETINAVAIETGYVLSAPATAVLASVAPAPTLTPGSGTYASGTTVTLTCILKGAIIYYTTDGSTPETTSTIYTGPIKLTASETIRAVVAKGGYAKSASHSANYVVSGS